MEKIEIKTIEMIRRIREAHYEQLKGKTHKEFSILNFHIFTRQIPGSFLAASSSPVKRPMI